MIPNKRPDVPRTRWLDFSKIVVDNKDINQSINSYYRSYPHLGEPMMKEVPSERIDKINGDVSYLYDNLLKDRGYTATAGKMSYNPIGETVFKKVESNINRGSTGNYMGINTGREYVMDPYNIGKEYTYPTREYPTINHYLYTKYKGLMEINSPEMGGDYGVYTMLFKVVEGLKKKLIKV
jgi:hypothetical protein